MRGGYEDCTIKVTLKALASSKVAEDGDDDCPDCWEDEFVYELEEDPIGDAIIEMISRSFQTDQEDLPNGVCKITIYVDEDEYDSAYDDLSSLEDAVSAIESYMDEFDSEDWIDLENEPYAVEKRIKRMIETSPKMSFCNMCQEIASYPSLSKRLKKIQLKATRERMGISQSMLAEALGVSTRSIKRWENFDDPNCIAPWDVFDFIAYLEEEFRETIDAVVGVIEAINETEEGKVFLFPYYRDQEDFSENPMVFEKTIEYRNDLAGDYEFAVDFHFVNAAIREAQLLLSRKGIKCQYTCLDDVSMKDCAWLNLAQVMRLFDSFDELLRALLKESTERNTIKEELC